MNRQGHLTAVLNSDVRPTQEFAMNRTTQVFALAATIALTTGFA